jgi:hypothetical protein
LAAARRFLRPNCRGFELVCSTKFTSSPQADNPRAGDMKAALAFARHQQCR